MEEGELCFFVFQSLQDCVLKHSREFGCPFPAHVDDFFEALGVEVQAEVFEGLVFAVDFGFNCLSECPSQVSEFGFEVGDVGDDEFCGGARGGCPYVGGEVAEGEVDFVSDGADHGGLAVVDCHDDIGVVEFEEVFEAAAAASDYDDVDDAVDFADCIGDFGVCVVALHGGG